MSDEKTTVPIPHGPFPPHTRGTMNFFDSSSSVESATKKKQKDMKAAWDKFNSSGGSSNLTNPKKNQLYLDQIKEIGTMSSMYLAHCCCCEDTLWEQLKTRGWCFLLKASDPFLLGPIHHEITTSIFDRVPPEAMLSSSSDSTTPFVWQPIDHSNGAFLIKLPMMEISSLAYSSEFHCPLFHSVFTSWITNIFHYHVWAVPYFFKWNSHKPANLDQTSQAAYHLNMPWTGDAVEKWLTLYKDKNFPDYLYPLVIVIGLSNGGALELSSKFKGFGKNPLKNGEVKSLDFGNVLVFCPDVYHRSVYPSPWKECFQMSICISYTPELADL